MNDAIQPDSGEETAPQNSNISRRDFNKVASGLVLSLSGMGSVASTASTEGVASGLTMGSITAAFPQLSVKWVKAMMKMVKPPYTEDTRFLIGLIIETSSNAIQSTDTIAARQTIAAKSLQEIQSFLKFVEGDDLNHPALKEVATALRTTLKHPIVLNPEAVLLECTEATNELNTLLRSLSHFSTTPASREIPKPERNKIEVTSQSLQPTNVYLTEEFQALVDAIKAAPNQPNDWRERLMQFRKDLAEGKDGVSL